MLTQSEPPFNRSCRGLLILGTFIGGPALKTKGEDDKAIA
jgi:hypothetical protein